MPESIDWPLQTQPPRRSRRTLLLFFAGLAAIFFGSRIALSLWVDLLWFRSLGYGNVFWKSRGLQWGVFLGVAAITFLVLYGAFSALKRAHRADLPNDHTIFIGGQPIKLSVEPVLHVLAVIVSVVVALVTGGAMQAQWPTLALYWYAPTSAGSVVDRLLLGLLERAEYLGTPAPVRAGVFCGDAVPGVGVFRSGLLSLLAGR